jgi:hypothetical protein
VQARACSEPQLPQLPAHTHEAARANTHRLKPKSATKDAKNKPKTSIVLLYVTRLMKVLTPKMA